MTHRWAASVRFIADQIPRAGTRTTLTYRFVPTFSAGLEWNPRADKASPLANWLALSETENRPALMFGTSSDRIGTPSGQSVYGTVSKSLKQKTGLPISPYLGLTFGTYEDRLRLIGGMSAEFTDRIRGQLIFDGVHLHEMLGYAFGRHVFSAILIRGDDPGLSYSISF
jgi:hypothetical protein